MYEYVKVDMCCECGERARVKRSIRCRECHLAKRREYTRNYYKANPERCRRSTSKYRITHEYKISLAIHEAMRRIQNGCAICHKDKPLVVDHNHDSGQVRELLCGDCNRSLGSVYEDKSILLRMIQYLNAWNDPAFIEQQNLWRNHLMPNLKPSIEISRDANRKGRMPAQ